MAAEEADEVEGLLDHTEDPDDGAGDAADGDGEDEVRAWHGSAPACVVKSAGDVCAQRAWQWLDLLVAARCARRELRLLPIVVPPLS